KRNLKSEVDKGRFREDLYFRVAVVPVTLPPLRERREDIPLLVEAFLDKMADASGSRPQLPPGGLQLLAAHDWPGNVRELRNMIERMVYLEENPEELGGTVVPGQTESPEGG